MDAGQNDGKLHRLTGQLIDAHQRPDKEQDESVQDAHDEVGPAQQLFCVVDCLLVVACADAPAYDRYHRKADGLARDAAHTVEVVGDGVGGDLDGAEGGDHADHDDAARLEQAVLKRRGHTDAEDAFCHAGVEADGLGHREGVALLVAAPQNERRRNDTGNDAGPCHAIDAHLEAEDADRISHDVDDVHQDADLHRDLGVAHAAEKGRARVVQREEGVAQGRYFKVQDTSVQHVRVDGAVAGADHGPGKEDAEHRHHRAQNGAQQNELACAGVGLFLLPCAQILAHHHRAAGGQCREQHDDEVVYHIHKADARDGRLAAAGDHHGVGHADGHGKELLDEQRPRQPQQVFLGKQRFPPAKKGLRAAVRYVFYHLYSPLVICNITSDALLGADFSFYVIILAQPVQPCKSRRAAYENLWCSALEHPASSNCR